MKAKADRVTPVLLVGSALFAVAGQYYLTQRRAFLWDGLLLYAVAMVLFTRVLARLEGSARVRVAGSPGFLDELWAALGQSHLRLGAVIAGATMSAVVTLSATARPNDRSFVDLLVLWLVAIALTASAFVEWGALPRWLADQWRAVVRHGPEVALVFLIALATYLLRGVDLERTPYVLLGDEAAMGLEAVNVLEGHSNNPFATGWFANPMSFFFIQAGFMRLFGVTITAVRLPAVLASTATVVLLYAFVRTCFGRWAAILSALLYCTYHYAIHYGRIGINNIFDPLLALGVFLFLMRGLDNHKVWPVLVAGVFAGLTIYFHAGARLIPMILLVYLAYRSLVEQGFLRKNLTRLTIFGIVALVVALPLLWFLLTHYGEMVAPWTRKSIIPSGWMVSQAKATGRSTLSVLFDQFMKAVLAFNYSYDPTVFYQPAIPLLQFVPSLFFVFGLAYALRSWRKHAFFLLCLWFLMVMVFGGALLENPPASYRLLLSIPPVVILVALGIERFAVSIQTALGRSPGVRLALSLGLVLICCYQSVHFYFGPYSHSYRFADVNTEVGNAMGHYLSTLGSEYRCYFLGSPRMFWNYPTIELFAPRITGTDVIKPITGDLSFVSADKRAVFVALPERRRELDVVFGTYPEGEIREFPGKRNQLLFIAYEVASP